MIWGNQSHSVCEICEKDVNICLVIRSSAPKPNQTFGWMDLNTVTKFGKSLGLAVLGSCAYVHIHTMGEKEVPIIHTRYIY